VSHTPGETDASLLRGMTSLKARPAHDRYSRAAETNVWRLLTLVAVTGLIWIGFHIWTGVFISPRNLSNLAVQMSATALLTCGLTWLLVAREIDLSVGSLQAMIAVTLMQLTVTYNWNIWPAVAVVILLGVVVGALQASARVFVLIPSFIVTLAGFSWLRGVTYVVSGAQTVSGGSDSFYLIGNGAVPKGLSLALILLVTALGIVAWLRRYTSLIGSDSRTPRPVNFIVLSLGVLFASLAVWVFGINGGIPYPLLVVALVAFSMDYIAKNTAFGRYVYAVGGNPESARRAGINIKAIVFVLFALMGALTAASGVIEASRLDSAPPNLGLFTVMDAISASIIGGTSLFGGFGTVPGALIGALLMSSITNGLGLAGVNTFYQMIITGMLLLVAVSIDMVSQRRKT
jgi:D-xylose transport system permease protein